MENFRSGTTYNVSINPKSFRPRVSVESTDVHGEATSTARAGRKRTGHALSTDGRPTGDGRESDLLVAQDTQSYRWIVLGPNATAELVGRTVTVVGELDATEADTLRSYFRGLSERPETIDCSSVSFVGAAGISALLAVADGSSSSSTIIASPIVARVAAICAVDKALGIWEPA